MTIEIYLSGKYITNEHPTNLQKNKRFFCLENEYICQNIFEFVLMFNICATLAKWPIL